MRLRLIENQEQLVRMARELVTRAIDIDDFIGQAQGFARERPEVTHLVWLDANRKRKAELLGPRCTAETGVTGNDDADPSLPSAERAEPARAGLRAGARPAPAGLLARLRRHLRRRRCSRCTCR